MVSQYSNHNKVLLTEFLLTSIATVFLDNPLEELEHLNTKLLTPLTAKQAKKSFKRTPDLSVVIFKTNSDNYNDVASLIQYLRQGLSNTQVRIIALLEDHTNQKHIELLKKYRVNTVVADLPQNRSCLAAIVDAELRTFSSILQSENRRETEVRILTTLGKMSREQYSDSDCVQNLLKLLEEATGSHTSRVFLSGDAEQPNPANPAQCSGDETDLGEGPWSLVQAAITQRCQQLCIDDTSSDHKRSANHTAASIALPLLCYDKTVAVLHLLLPAESLATLTVEFVELLGKMAEQVRILFERRASEGELETQYERVKSALSKLEATQMKLYQSEKLASVGQLAAGIAHEINNPITFLAGNMRPLEDYTDAMSSMLELHQNFIKEIDGSTPKLWDLAEKQIKPKAEELDIAFIMDDVRSLVSESKEGLQRVSDIVQNLTRFARKDTVEYAPGNLETGLDDTLTILRKDIGETISVQRDYAGIPEIVCSHGLLNQVFLNLVKNAAQAIGSNGTIIIKTETIQTTDAIGSARVTITDDGEGIPEESKGRIFEPFFTTKAVGQGTGLGLSMCYDIIDRHGGELSFTSEPGSGTSFILEIPLKPIAADIEQQNVA